MWFIGLQPLALLEFFNLEDKYENYNGRRF
jgi:hypothetical protein